MRYFAVLESLDGDVDQEHVYLDCISQETFSVMRRVGGLAQFSSEQADEYMGAVLQVRRESFAPSLLDRINNASVRIWFTLTVSEVRDDAAAVDIPATFVSLAPTAADAEAITLYISRPEALDADTQAAAERIFDATQLAPNSFERFARRLEKLFASEGRRHVVAYHVGQGNCNAVVDEHEHPVLFFDLGWPIQTNIAGAPNPPPQLFDVQSDAGIAPVVLSHWDWDHWAYALESWRYDRARGAPFATWKSAALHRPWLVPAPEKAMKLGPSHYLLILKLYHQRWEGRRALHFWSRRKSMWETGNLTLLKCSTKKRDVSYRNNSGLAMVVRIDDGWKRGLVLLPGDCEFDSIQFDRVSSWDSRRIVAMVASHHGGKLNVFAIPETTVSDARLVISSGKNRYGHPNSRMLDNYRLQGWHDQQHTNSWHHRPRMLSLVPRIGATLVQPVSFDKPRCECEGIPDANMSLGI
ncbi:hypothetical protein [Burkholderia sp. RS02]|uniref:hypothetical protein n=1 Tax=unclassified Burkholderia TaxID=2613784 RepID=UPI0032183B91